ncbi:MAG: hypothetical protein FJ225_10195 [Lentisphaerae bacterium]|nr:hypothetical protein [Lentisphaerota bacterium]
MSERPPEIVCAACGAETLVRREAVYDGFKRVGERFVCVSCGHAYAAEAEVPFKAAKRTAVFSEADRTRSADVFAADEKGRNCRHCRHYVVNPFTQRCGLHLRRVEATDACGDFEPPPAADEPPQTAESSPPPPR